MTLRYIYQGADFSRAAVGRNARMVSNRAGMVGEYLPGRDAITSAFNLANPQLPLTIVGTPGFDRRHANLDAKRYLSTGVYDSAELTLLAVCRVINGSTAPIFITFNGGNADSYLSLIVGDAGIPKLQTADAGGSRSEQAGFYLPDPKSDWVVLAARTSGTDNYVAKIDLFRGGKRVATSGGPTGKTRVVDPIAPICIGSAHGLDTFAGPTSIAGAYIRHVALTDAELLADVVEVTALMATFGITA